MDVCVITVCSLSVNAGSLIWYLRYSIKWHSKGFIFKIVTKVRNANSKKVLIGSLTSFLIFAGFYFTNVYSGDENKDFIMNSNSLPSNNGEGSKNINNDNGQTVTMTDNKTILQALDLINDCNKYKMDLTTNAVVITNAIKFVHTNKEDEDHLEENQEEETGEIKQETTNEVF